MSVSSAKRSSSKSAPKEPEVIDLTSDIDPLAASISESPKTKREDIEDNGEEDSEVLHKRKQPRGSKVAKSSKGPIEVIDLTLLADDDPVDPFSYLPIRCKPPPQRTLDGLQRFTCSEEEEAKLDAFLRNVTTRSRTGWRPRLRTRPYFYGRPSGDTEPGSVAPEATETMLDSLQRYVTRYNKRRLVDINGIPINASLVKSLVQYGSWLDDECINGYLALLAERYPTVKFFSTFFYSMLVQKNSKDYNYERVRRWTRRRPRGAFSYEKLIIPINRSNSHWYVAFINQYIFAEWCI
jgi:hypothetical protein